MFARVVECRSLSLSLCCRFTICALSRLAKYRETCSTKRQMLLFIICKEKEKTIPLIRNLCIKIINYRRLKLQFSSFLPAYRSFVHIALYICFFFSFHTYDQSFFIIYVWRDRASKLFQKLTFEFSRTLWLLQIFFPSAKE